MFERAASAPATRGVGDDCDKHGNDEWEWTSRQNDSRKLAGIGRIKTSLPLCHSATLPLLPKSEWESFAAAHDSGDSLILERQPHRYSSRSNMTLLHRTRTLQ